MVGSLQGHTVDSAIGSGNGPHEGGIGAQGPDPKILDFADFGGFGPWEASERLRAEKLVPKDPRSGRELVGRPENSIFRRWTWIFTGAPPPRIRAGGH